MQYSVIIPTRRTIEQFMPTLYSLSMQEVQPQQIFLLLDQNIDTDTYNQYKQTLRQKLGDVFYKKLLLVSHIDSLFQINKGVSYVRNYGFSLVDTPLVLSVDDDNTFDKDFCARLLQAWIAIHQKYKEDSVLIPTEMCKGQIRPRGYQKFIYWLGIQQQTKIKKRLVRKFSYGLSEKIYPIQFASSNCLFGATKIFQQHPFDERIEFVYEDFDMTKRITNDGYMMFVLLDLNINHNMRDKTPLQKTYLSNVKEVYQKARNRSIFVKNTGAFRDKLDYFLLGIWIHTVFLLYKILRYASPSDRKSLIKSLWKGTKDGIFS